MHRTLLQYLDDILEAAVNIGEDTHGLSYTEFISDRRRKDAVVRNFEIIGEASKETSRCPQSTVSIYRMEAGCRIAGRDCSWILPYRLRDPLGNHHQYVAKI